MNIETEGLVERYLQWLRESSSERELDGGWKALTLPFLDHHNDHLEVYVRQGLDGLRITDEGRIARDLKHIGCDLKAKTKRRSLAERILKGLGLDPDNLDTGAITTTAVNGDFPQKLHNLLLSMLAIDGLASVSPQNVVAPFKEEVADWLKAIGAPAERDVKYTGHSKIAHEFDFEIPPTANKRAQVVHTLNVPDRIHVQSFIFSAIDIRESLNVVAPEFHAILNDQASASKKLYLALLSRDIDPIRWSERDQCVSKLAG